MMNLNKKDNEMDFKEAFIAIHKGEKVRRSDWPNHLHLKKQTIISTEDASEVEIIKSFRQECIPFQYNLSILNSSDWIIVGEEDSGLIKFTDAIDALRKGKYVKLKEWDSDCYLGVSQNQKEIYMMKYCEYEYIPTFQCFLSNDWETI